MTKTEQKQLIRAYAKGITETMIERLPRVPEHWNGIELRNWFAILGPELYHFEMEKKRKKDFLNTILVNNL